MVDVALRSFFTTPASEPKLTEPEEVQEAIRGLNVSKATVPERYPEQGLAASPTASGIPNRAWQHLPQRAVSFLVLIFNEILLTQYFPTA